MRRVFKDPRFRTALRWIGTILSTALFIVLISRIDFDQALALIKNLSIPMLLFALICFFASQLFNTLRWYSLLHAQQIEITYFQALKIVMAGVFASNFLPSTIGGDSVRLIAAFRYSSRKSIVIGSIVLDRVINMSAMIFILPLAFTTFGAKLLALFKGSVFIPQIKSLRDKTFEKLKNAYQAWALHPWMFIRAYIIAWLSILALMLGVWVCALALSMPVTFMHVMSVTVVSYFISLLPISVNGVGLREVIFTTLYVELGASLEQATTLALLTRLLIMIGTLPGAFWISDLVAPAKDQQA